jgi:hypothetical protein
VKNSGAITKAFLIHCRGRIMTKMALIAALEAGNDSALTIDIVKKPRSCAGAAMRIVALRGSDMNSSSLAKRDENGVPPSRRHQSFGLHCWSGTKKAPGVHRWRAVTAHGRC